MSSLGCKMLFARKRMREAQPPPCKQQKPGWNRISGLRFPWWLHSAALPIGRASCFGFSNRGSDTHPLPDWPGCAAVPWQRGQRDQSLQDDGSHHLPGVELRVPWWGREGDAKRNREPHRLSQPGGGPSSAVAQVGGLPLIYHIL